MAKKEAPKEQPKSEREAALNDTGMAGLVGKTIDERMADLLKEHKKMGVR